MGSKQTATLFSPFIPFLHMSCRDVAGARWTYILYKSPTVQNFGWYDHRCSVDGSDEAHITHHVYHVRVSQAENIVLVEGNLYMCKSGIKGEKSLF